MLLVHPRHLLHPAKRKRVKRKRKRKRKKAVRKKIKKKKPQEEEDPRPTMQKWRVLLMPTNHFCLGLVACLVLQAYVVLLLHSLFFFYFLVALSFKPLPLPSISFILYLFS